MSTPTRPSTPVAQSTPSTPVTGTWRHPKLDEIVRRQNASNFTASNVKKIAYNGGGLLVVFVIGRALWTFLPSLFHPGKALTPYADWAYYILQLVFLFNIVMACMPLVRTPDDISDIPLTPAQRKLLGLPPSSAPPTPGSQYVTPPRYARTTPVGGSPGARGNYSGSPLSAKGSPNGSTTGLPFSPGSSPLLQKAMGGGMNGTRRASYGSPSPLGPSLRLGQETPGSPSPASKTGGIGLNSKWLYDKGRRNSGSSRLYS
ncbi:nuclear pore complex component-domain-containing protein [Rhexocercosporidium sp. MPI-PUGE-AT-0058]|nr:nuclear pore complex component-domain-containing protein [Rhexocercosporidium sp. MPI-PUGE-AT-0058]